MEEAHDELASALKVQIILNMWAGEAENPKLGEERMNEYIYRYQKDIADLETANQEASRALDCLNESEEDERGTLGATAQVNMRYSAEERRASGKT